MKIPKTWQVCVCIAATNERCAKGSAEVRRNMTKEVLIKISGLQFAGDTENEPVEIITSGDYYKRNGKHYILYDEVMEGFTETTKNIIKLNEDMLDITKRALPTYI